MTSSNVQEKSFFASLFDFDFTSFITLRFLKVIYKLVVALILLGGLLSLIYGLTSGSALGVISGLILAPLLTVVYLVLARIGLEVVAMFFRIGDDAALAVQLLGGNRKPSPAYPASPTPSNPEPAPVVPNAAAPYPTTPPPTTPPPSTQPPASAPPARGQDAPTPPAADDHATTVFPIPPADHDGWGPTTPSR